MGQRELERFAGAAVIVTGGAHGIGRACAAWLAEEGAHIGVVDLDQTAAQEVGRDKRVEPIASATSIRSDVSGNPRTWLPRSPSLLPAMQPGSPDTHSPSTAAS
jgi:NAD(P)-dependent dehydrogenase (short-subunit alcohol dehydrogenase family)